MFARGTCPPFGSFLQTIELLASLLTELTLTVAPTKDYTTQDAIYSIVTVVGGYCGDTLPPILTVCRHLYILALRYTENFSMSLSQQRDGFSLHIRTSTRTAEFKCMIKGSRIYSESAG